MIRTFTCFDGFRRIASGQLPAVAPQLRRALAAPAPGPVLLFDDASGRTIDIDSRDTEQQLLARLSAADEPDGQALSRRRPPGAASDAGMAQSAPVAIEPRGRGRPKLGVVAREVTLLPRHWDWLAAQPGGASVALRKLVEQARRAGKDDTRQRHERAYHFMSALAGDLPGFEEAIRALFANAQERFDDHVGAWPPDVRAHAAWLAFGGAGPAADSGAVRDIRDASQQDRVVP